MDLAIIVFLFWVQTRRKHGFSTEIDFDGGWTILPFSFVFDFEFLVPLEVAGRARRLAAPRTHHEFVSVTRDGCSGRWVPIIVVLTVNRKRPSSEFRRGGEAEGDKNENNAAYLPPAERLIGKEARASDGNERRCPGEDAG
ncbi:MAG: hypothetical protein ACM3Q0_01275 [Bacteroidota bacterium]